MKNKKYFTSLLLASCFSLLASISHAYTFNFDLSVGSSGQDVYELQKFLNSYSPETVISQSGVGSPGNETSYFGNLTRNALQIFQNLNFDQILKPANLTSGTGYFGPSTRNFVNIYTKPSSNSVVPPTISQTTHSNTSLFDQNIQQQLSSTREKNMSFLLLSKKVIRNGEEIFVADQSSKDISNLDFYIENHKISKDCKSAFVCKLEIDLSEIGKKYLTTNDKTITPEIITVLDKNTKVPSVNLKSIRLGVETSVKGENLSAKIKIYTPLGVFESNTKNNTFKIKIDNPENVIKENTKWLFYVENDNGLKSDIITVNYEI